MKINKVFLACILALSMLLGSFSIVYAAEPTMAITDESGNVVSGSVSASSPLFVKGSANPGEIVMLSVLKPISEGEVLSDSTLGLYLYWVDDVIVSDDGSYSFSLDFSLCPTGNYIIRVATSDTDFFTFAVQSVVNEEDRDAAIAAINAAPDVNAIKNLFVNSDADRSLSLGVSAYKRLGTLAADDVYKAVFDYKNSTPLTVTNLQTFNTDVFEKSSILALYNQENSSDIIKEFSTVFCLSDAEPAKSTYNLIQSENKKSQALEAVCLSDYSSISDMQKAYSLSVCLYAIESAPWQNFDVIVGSNATLFGGLNISAYTSLKYKSAVALEVSGVLYGNAQDFELAFNNSVSKQLRAEQTNTNNNISGGSSGTSSGGSYGGGSSSVIGVGGTAAQTPELEPIEDTGFTDVNDVEWARTAIEYLFEKEIVSGVAKNIFAPHNTVKREEFVKMLVLVLNKYDSEAKCSFGDVPADNWSYSYVASAFNAGLVNGIDENKFGLGNEISRQDACVLLYRAISDKKPGGNAIEFTDKAEIADYAKNAVDAMSSMGLVNGMDDGTFKPQDVMTRAQAAKLLYELCKVIGG